jgi:hypothetical protein
VPIAERPRAFRKLVTLLKPRGMMAITLRVGPSKPDRGMQPVSEEEIERLARDHGAFVIRRREQPDELGRDNVRWLQLVVRLPNDGTGALPLQWPSPIRRATSALRENVHCTCWVRGRCIASGAAGS